MNTGEAGRQDRLRVCFQLRVRPERMAEYTARHAAVWPEMLTALRDAGWHNYSLFLADGGLLIGYFETEDLDAALSQMAQTSVNARWQAQMAPFFADQQVTPDAGLMTLTEVFNLQHQLDQLTAQPPPGGVTDDDRH